MSLPRVLVLARADVSSSREGTGSRLVRHTPVATATIEYLVGVMYKHVPSLVARPAGGESANFLL